MIKLLALAAVALICVGICIGLLIANWTDKHAAKPKPPSKDMMEPPEFLMDRRK